MEIWCDADLCSIWTQDSSYLDKGRLSYSLASNCLWQHHLVEVQLNFYCLKMTMNINTDYENEGREDGINL